MHNPQGPEGKQAPSILNFYDGDDNFILPYKQVLKPTSVKYLKVLDDTARARACDKRTDRIAIVFKKTVR